MDSFITRSRKFLSEWIGVRPSTSPAPRQLGGNLARRSIFSGASIGNLTTDWQARSVQTSATTELTGEGQRLRNRARELTRNDPYAEKFAGEFQKNVIGDAGILVAPKIKKLRGSGFREALNQDIKDGWRRWGRKSNASTDRRSSIRDIEWQVARQLAVENEFLVLVDRADDNPFHFSLQVTDTDQLDWNYRDDLPNKNTIRFGIEQDPRGRIVAYHIFSKHPVDTNGRRDRIRYPASEVLYDFLPTRPGQMRGLPRMASAMYRLNMLRGFDEATLAAARKGACQTAAISRDLPPDRDDPSFNGEQPPVLEGGGPEVIDLDPSIGAIYLAPGEAITQLNPTHPTAAYEPFVKQSLHGICAGLDIAYMSLTGDLRESSYSSARVGLLNEHETWYCMHQWLIEHFIEPAYMAWLENANLYGQLFVPGVDLEGVLDQTTFRGRGFDWVDPTKDTAAAISGIDNGLDTWSWQLARRGYTIDELCETLKSDIAAFKKAGIPMPLGLNAAARPTGTTPEPMQEDVGVEPVAPVDGGTPPKVKPNGKANGKANGHTAGWVT